MNAARPTLSARHLWLALVVVAIWGSNFVVIKLALAHLPPLLLATLRFALAALPLVLLVRRPPVSWGNLALYGLTIGVGQFGLLFYVMTRHISPGLASLVIQSQVFFTVGLSMLLSGERVRPFQLVAALIAVAGIVLIASRSDGQTTPLGLVLTLAAALSWALGNIASRAAGPVNVLAYVAWAWLLARYPAATVAPFSLLVPVFGMGASAALLAEPLPPWKLIAAALVMGGLALNLLWPRLRRRPGC